MGGYIHQQLLLANGRTHHELVQSVDCIHRQLTLRADYACTQLPQVEGRIYHKLLQMAGNVHYQLLMANSFPSHYVRQDVSQPVNADGGYHGNKEQDVFPATMYNGIFPDVSRDVSSSANADGECSAAKEGANIDGSHSVHYQLKADGGCSAAKQGATVDGSHGVHYQLLMASSPSNNHGQPDVSPPTIADGGHHGAKGEGED